MTGPLRSYNTDDLAALRPDLTGSIEPVPDRNQTRLQAVLAALRPTGPRRRVKARDWRAARVAAGFPDDVL